MRGPGFPRSGWSIVRQAGACIPAVRGGTRLRPGRHRSPAGSAVILRRSGRPRLTVSLSITVASSASAPVTLRRLSPPRQKRRHEPVRLRRLHRERRERHPHRQRQVIALRARRERAAVRRMRLVDPDRGLDQPAEGGIAGPALELDREAIRAGRRGPERRGADWARPGAPALAAAAAPHPGRPAGPSARAPPAYSRLGFSSYHGRSPAAYASAPPSGSRFCPPGR